MNTPICDFVRRYAESGTARLHMPGHKGCGPLGVEALDITEIDGADSLYEAQGIIRESEDNASRLFGCPTFYSTEGSSHAIRAMLALTAQHAAEQSGECLVWAGRNAHKVLVSTLALLDIRVHWLDGDGQSSYLSCTVDADALDAALDAAEQKPTAVYVTSPDYLGNMTDIASVAAVCHRHGVLLLVDNAHGAYLHFLSESYHPIALGADMCAESAHKTLPVLTGGAYLHISPRAPVALCEHARRALALFGSTSPSYLILQSLDAANAALAGDFPARIEALRDRMARLRQSLLRVRHAFFGCEPLKLTLDTKLYGYSGYDFAARLRENGVECEFADPDMVVLMFSPSLDESDIDRVQAAILAIERREPLLDRSPRFALPACAMPIRAAVLAPSETVAVSDAVGRVAAVASVGCPPAVPIVMPGEVIDERAVACMTYYGIHTCQVVKK